jgi:hypothetical protein
MMFGKKSPGEQRNQVGVETQEVHAMPSSPISGSLEVVGIMGGRAKRGGRLVSGENHYPFLGVAPTPLRLARPRHIRGIPTDRIKFDVKTMNIASLPLPHFSPQSSQITKTVQEMNLEGWVLAGKTHHEGFFGLTPYTHLVFLRPRL